ALRMNALIEDLLNYSSASKDEKLFVATDLNIIVQEVLMDLEVSIQLKNARIEVNKLPEIKAIPHQMRQLFQNLISNSLKYSKADITPFIQIYSRKPEATRVQIIIKDNGIGFDKEYAN